MLFRCASELLANAATHSAARHVTLRLDVEDGDDVLEVIDDGIGFDPERLDERLREGHIGVLSLRERAEGLGGSLRIDSAFGRGARLEVRLPREPVPIVAIGPPKGDSCASSPSRGHGLLRGALR